MPPDRPPSRRPRGRRRSSSRSARTLAEVGEFGFLDTLLPELQHPPRRGVCVDLGDDAAVVDPRGERIVLTTDAIVEDVHFRRGWLSDRQLGRRAFLVNASDIAAMGATSTWCLVSLGAPGDTPQQALLEMMLGIAEAARDCGAAVVGGNVSGSPVVFLSVSLVGTLRHEPLTRGGARPGDLLCVSGHLGGAAWAVRRWSAGRPPSPRSRVFRAWAEPPARTTLGPRLAASGAVSAMIDLSDGFRQDLGHLCEASAVGAEVDVRQLPVCPGIDLPAKERLALAVSGGEDYELLFTVRPRRMARVEAIAAELGCPVTVVGVVTDDPAIRSRDGDLQPLVDEARGHDHFRGDPTK